MRVFVGTFIFLFLSIVNAESFLPIGTWKAVKYVPVYLISSSPTEIRRNLHRRLIVTAVDVRLAGKICKIEDRQVLSTDEEANLFFSKKKMDFSALGVHAPINIIDTSCNTLIVGPKHEMFFDKDGDFYRAGRVRGNQQEHLQK